MPPESLSFDAAKTIKANRQKQPTIKDLVSGITSGDISALSRAITLVESTNPEHSKKANAVKLILGHYSSRYDDLNLFKEEAETVFDNVILAKEGKVIKLDNKIPHEFIIAYQN